MNIIAFIFARGGSKGLPGKNIRIFNGKPLIAWSIEHAQSVKRIKRIIVSTDSEEIAIVAKNYGAEVPFLRPSELAKDDSPEWFAWRHALNYIKESCGTLPEIMVSVPTTAPLRRPIDIENALDLYLSGGVDAVVTVSEARRNPYFNIVKKNPDGTVVLVNKDSENIIRRQDAPKVYDMATICYVACSEFVMYYNSLFEGRVKALVVPLERAIDIDTLLDFQIAESISNIKNFKIK